MLKADGVPLYLVGDELTVHGFVQRIELEGVKVGNTDFANQTVLLELLEGAGGFPHVQAGILTVDEVEIKVVGAEAFQTLMAGLKHAVIRGVVITEAVFFEDAGLGNQLNAAADGGIGFESATHQGFAERIGIDLGGVEAGHAAVDALVHKGCQPFVGHVPAVQTPEALHDLRKTELLAEFNFFHNGSSCQMMDRITHSCAYRERQRCK